LFEQVAIILLLSALGGLIALKLKQPILISFIAIGILCGPSALGLSSDNDSIGMLSKLGVSLLLFVVGLKLDLNTVRTMGKVALATGLGQVFFTSVVGYVIARFIGFDHLNSIYISVALTFSSTIIIVKLITDKKEIDSLHGRIAIGFLIVQDLVVVLVMIALSMFSGEAKDVSLGQALLTLIVNATGLLSVAWLALRYLFPRILRHVAKSSELLVLFSIAWAVTLAVFSQHLGFSEEVGAFLAGMSLASSDYREAIVTRLVALRDFLLLFFFIDLGASLDIDLLGQVVLPALIFSLFVLIGNPLIVVMIMGYLGYRKRTGLLAGLTVAQISEFSLILMALAFSLGHVNEEALAVVTLVGIITISLSTYMILYSSQLYEFVSPYLSIFERKVPYAEQLLESSANVAPPEVILFGVGRFGKNIFKELRKQEITVLAFDFDPDLVADWQSTNQPVYYGNAQDPEFLAHLPLSQTKWVISAIADIEFNLSLADTLEKLNYQGKVALTLHRSDQLPYLKKAHYHQILLPFADAAERVVEKLWEKK